MSVRKYHSSARTNSPWWHREGVGEGGGEGEGQGMGEGDEQRRTERRAICWQVLGREELFARKLESECSPV
jgi:hypothetical protein